MIGDRWGVTPAETGLSYPCDEFVPAPGLQAWRAVTCAAPAEQVWPWIGQIRLAPYSYDWLDNLGRRSPARLLDLPEPVVGERFTTTAGRSAGRIVSVTAGEQLTGEIMGVFMSYVLAPAGPDTTRLLLKLVARRRTVATPLLCLGDLVMARRQLLNFARLAESTAIPSRIA